MKVRPIHQSRDRFPYCPNIDRGQSMLIQSHMKVCILDCICLLHTHQIFAYMAVKNTDKSRLHDSFPVALLHNLPRFGKCRQLLELLNILKFECIRIEVCGASKTVLCSGKVDGKISLHDFQTVHF